MLCTTDPLLKAIRETFDCSPVKVPEERLAPLVLLSRDPLAILSPERRRAEWRGVIAEAFDALHPLPPVQEADVSVIKGTRTTSVKKAAAVMLVDGLRRLFNVDDADAKLDAALASSDVETVAFSFPDPRRRWVDEIALGHAMRDATLKRNPATERFFGSSGRLLIVSSVIVSDRISLELGGRSARSASADAGAVTLSANVAARQEMSLRAKGTVAVAFKAFPLDIDNEGRVVRFGTSRDVLMRGVLPGDIPIQRPRPVLLGEETDLVEVVFEGQPEGNLQS